MSQRVSIPVKVIRPAEGARADAGFESRKASTQPANPGATRTGSQPEDRRAGTTTGPDTQASPPVALDPETSRPEQPDEAQTWRDHALRLQADMENYRKRQQRLAETEIQSERERLLGSFLQIVDDLERALAASDAAGQAAHPGYQGAANLPTKTGQTTRTDLYRGIELTHRSALQLLHKEGVESIEARNEPFDPNWHEAVTTMPRNGHQVDPGTVIQVLQTGYRLGDRLLRPAKVVVAV